MAAPRRPENADADKAKTGLKPGDTPSTDRTRATDRPVEEEDVFGGAERTCKGQDVESPGSKP